MLYNENSELPSAVKVLPSAAQSMFRSSFNTAYERGNGDASSFKIAWAVVKNRFVQTGESWVARAGAFNETTYYTFDATLDKELVTRTKDGHLVQTFILTDNIPDKFGTKPTDTLMAEWAEKLKIEQPELDTDHELFEAVVQKFRGNSEMIARAMKAKKGIAKIIDAVVDKGKLLVKVLFDKRYEKFASKIRGLSIEAENVRNKLTNEWVSGNLFGATLAVNMEVGNPRAVAVAV